MQPGRGSRPPRPSPRRDVVARAAQVRLQRAQDLRLVVDDEDPLRRSRSGASAGSSTRAARARTTRPARLATRPERGRRSPPRSRARSRGRGRRRAGPRCPATRWNGSKIARSSSSGMPGLVDDADDQLLPRRVTRTCTGSSGGENLSAFSSRLTSTRWTWAASTRTGGRSGRALDVRRARAAPSSSRACASSSSAVQSSGLGSAARPGAATGRAGSRPAASSRACSTRIVSSSVLPVARRSSASSPLCEAVERLLDRGERRAQVVRDGLDDGRLDRVAAAQRLGLERLARELLALAGDGEERGEGRQEAPLDARRGLLALAACRACPTCAAVHGSACGASRASGRSGARRARSAPTRRRGAPRSAARSRSSSSSSRVPRSSSTAMSASSAASRSRCSASARGGGRATPARRRRPPSRRRRRARTSSAVGERERVAAARGRRS